MSSIGLILKEFKSLVGVSLESVIFSKWEFQVPAPPALFKHGGWQWLNTKIRATENKPVLPFQLPTVEQADNHSKW